MATNKKNTNSKIRNLFKSKLFVASLAFYILVPVFFVLVSVINFKSSTAGEYYYYENGELAAKITLTIRNNVEIKFYKDNCHSDKEYTYNSRVDKWSYRVSNWEEHYDPDLYKHLSREYIRFGGKESECFYILFKIGDRLYTDYLLDEDRGGGQKCYIKK